MNDLWDPDKDHILRQALNLHGAPQQETQTVEEMSELTVALLHRRRGKAGDRQVLEEMADVLIMLRQLSFLYGESALREAVEAKMRKLARSLPESARDRADLE